MKMFEAKEWKPIQLQDYFELSRGRESKTTTKEGGIIPFVSAKKSNNGYRMFVEESKTIIPSNTMSLNNNGDGGAGFGYYQPHEYTVDVNTTALIPRENNPLDKDLGLFWSGSFSWMHDYFGNARTLSNSRAKAIKIMMPTNHEGNPDFECMKEYIKECRKKMLRKYCEYAIKRLNEVESAVTQVSLMDKKWDAFHIPELFENIQRGKRLKNADHIAGKIPYVSSTANNNGVDDFIEATKGTRVFEDCISLANSGSVGKAFYEPFAFVASDHITHLKTQGMSRYVYLFLAAVIEKQKCNFNFNREINDRRIQTMRIMLPTNSAGEPDYVYMEEYVRCLMKNKYMQYFVYIKKQLEDNM